MFANARAATALAFASSAVVFADARAPTLSAKVLLSIVGALLADRRHLSSALCFLLLLADEPVSARSSKKYKALARSSKKGKA